MRAFDVRVLVAADVALLREVLSMFGAAFGEAPTYMGRQPDDAYLQGLLASSTFVAVAAVAEGKAIALYTKLGAREDVLHFDIAPRKAP